MPCASDAGAPQPARSPLPPAPAGWSVRRPGLSDVPELTALLRRHERNGRGWAGATTAEVQAEVSARGYQTRDHVVLCDDAGAIRGWAAAHDRAAGRLVLVVVVDHRLIEDVADEVAAWLFGWADAVAVRVGRRRGLERQQLDSGSFEDDRRQTRWLERAGYRLVRTWWQMSRPVQPGEVSLGAQLRDGVRIRLVERQGDDLPSTEDLRTVHDVLETAFEDHFNAHEETFDEFAFRLREDPGHRWDHWWIAELVDGGAPEPAGTLVGAVRQGEGDAPDGSYVEYLGVLPSARGRGVARSLLATVIADAAARGRNRVGLEVDADSPTGADRLYVSMGWRTDYVTRSWHRFVDVPG